MTASLYKKYRQVPKKQCFRGSTVPDIIETSRTKGIVVVRLPAIRTSGVRLFMMVLQKI